MGRELDVHRGGLVSPGTRPVAAPAPGATSTSSMGFDGQLTEFADLPPGVAAACSTDGQVLAELAFIHRQSARRIDGAPHQTLEAFRATASELVVVTGARLLATAGRRQRPAGPWQVHDVERVAPTSAPRRRTGRVDAGTVPSTGGLAHQGHPRPAAAGPVVPPDQRDALVGWAVLPPQVRQYAEAQVPSPRRWLCEIAQYTTDGMPYRQQITALRQDDRLAVVITADRWVPAEPWSAGRLTVAPWDVQQLVYDVGSDAGRLEPARSRPSLGR